MVKTIRLQDLQAALDRGVVGGFYDNRSTVSYERLHIKGSTSLPVADARLGKGLPADKNAFLVFY